MKRWTRKLLAGLLSVGMLLQVASPLSALGGGDSYGEKLHHCVRWLLKALYFCHLCFEPLY